VISSLTRRHAKLSLTSCRQKHGHIVQILLKRDFATNYSRSTYNRPFLIYYIWFFLGSPVRLFNVITGLMPWNNDLIFAATRECASSKKAAGSYVSVVWKARVRSCVFFGMHLVYRLR